MSAQSNDKGGCYSAYHTPPTPLPVRQQTGLDRGESSSHYFCDSQTLFFQEKKFNIHKERGFTLIEVLISIFVLSIGIFGVMALFPVGIHQIGKIAKNTIGAISAETPIAYAWYKYPAGNTGGIDYDIRDIVNLISGTTTPACYFYPETGTITISGNVSYGWNTSLVPVDMDSNGTSTTIGETYLFRQQTAIYKNYTTNTGTATFTYNSTTISSVSNINTISVNNYICNTQNHIWYRVTGVNKSASSVTIQQSYEYGTTTAAPYISTNTIIGLYNSLLAPN
ncbi:MAG: prepilin-type N-terminal cleavage/methylation domain-containing protein [Candidatus Brocadiaceae bacterium]|nr:prepilin-type N-terminal cleavage/methylation domain-containing protein [Candidatus Brocadiaceae bacterium]